MSIIHYPFPCPFPSICCLLSVIFAYAGVSMSLAGEHQLQNAATAVTAVLALRDLSLLPSITTSMVLKGLEEASLPGRFQVRALLPISSQTATSSPARSKAPAHTLQATAQNIIRRGGSALLRSSTLRAEVTCCLKQVILLDRLVVCHFASA